MKTTLSIYMAGQRDPLVIERGTPSELDAIVRRLHDGATDAGAAFYDLPFAATQSRPQTVVNCRYVSHYTVRTER